MPKVNFGIHQLSIRGRVNGEEVIANATYIDSAESNIEAENIKLETGSYRNPVHTIRGRETGQVNLVLRSFDASLFKLLAPQKAGAFTYNENDTVGSIEILGGLDAATGIAGITINDSDSLKFGTYWLKWITPTTVNVYLDNNISLDYTDESGLVQEGLVIADGAATTWQGLDITGGTAVAGTIGEIVSFNVVPPSAKYFKQIFGQSGMEVPEVECRIFGEKVDNQIQKTTWYRCKSNGNVVPKNMTMEYASMEVTLDILADIAKGKTGETEWVELPA